MQLEKHKEEVPFAHYVQLFCRQMPEAITARLPQVQWDGKEFYVNLLDGEYALAHPEYAIRALNGSRIPPLPVQTFLLRYLLEGKDVPWLGRWMTFREMPWGEVYGKPFAGRALTRAAFAFGPRLEAFRTACQKLGGVPVAHGDAGYEFRFIGDYGMQIFLWAGDEEFPPSAQILYSDNFAHGFSAEDRVVAADILICAIKSNM